MRCRRKSGIIKIQTLSLATLAHKLHTYKLIDLIFYFIVKRAKPIPIPYWAIHPYKDAVAVDRIVYETNMMRKMKLFV